MKILLTGGGTGGHVYPAVALAEALVERGEETLFVGMRGGIEERIVPASQLPMSLICAAPLRRKLSFSLFSTLFFNVVGLFQALAIALRFRPDVVIATGGYVSFPVVAAARVASWLSLRSLFVGLVEPNAVPGLTNRLLAPLVNEVWGGFEQKSPAFAGKFQATGTPVRSTMRHQMTREDAASLLGLDPTKTIILVIGGSQGARTLNSAVAMMSASPLETGWQILHLCGKREEASAVTAQAMAIARGDVRVIGYLDDPAAAYTVADIVVARAGASTIAELAAAGKPALLVPYPYATADHQRFNAEAIAKTGAARMLLDQDLDGDRLLQELHAMLAPEAYAELSAAAQSAALHDATTTILGRLREAASLAKGSTP